MEEELEAIGFSKNESKAYLAIAQLGSTTIGAIAKQSKIHRTNVYDAIEGLLKKGLISYIEKDGSKFYQMAEATNILNILKEKEDRIHTILPQLQLLQQMGNNKSEAQIFEGLPAARRAMENFLIYGEPIMVMGVSRNVGDLVGPFLAQFHRKRLALKIPMMHIYNTDALERIKILKAMPYTPVRILPSEYNSPVATNIVGDEVTMIYWDKDAIVIRIKNRKIADVYRKYFELLWKQARPA
jgi:DNA-binding MarR family transcriptional regulator